MLDMYFFRSNKTCCLVLKDFAWFHLPKRQETQDDNYEYANAHITFPERAFQEDEE